jgi:hypothetical protein
MIGRLRTSARNFSTILPSGEKAERELSAVEREFMSMKESQFSKLGLYRKRQTNVGSLMKLFQLAQSGSKSDYAACLYCVNHFYNFGVEIDHHDFASRWLALAIETSRIDEAVEIVRTYNTWLSSPPRVELINVLIGMVKSEQARDLLKTIRENWQIPLSPTAYTTVISRLLAQGEVTDALAVWKDAFLMDVKLQDKLFSILTDRLIKQGMLEEAESVESSALKQRVGGLLSED